MYGKSLQTLSSVGDNQSIASVVVVMAVKSGNTVVLRVEVPEQFRTRLKTQAVRLGLTMGELIQRTMDTHLEQLEMEALAEVEKSGEPSTFKELVRQRYFELMNAGKIGHQRLKELSYGQKATPKERQQVAQTLGLEEGELPND